MEIASHKLDTSVGVPGPHGFAVRKQLHSSRKPPASIASRPAFDTFAQRPFCRDRMSIVLEVIWGRGQPKSFFKRDLTEGQITSVFQKLSCRRQNYHDGQKSVRMRYRSTGLGDGCRGGAEMASRCIVSARYVCFWGTSVIMRLVSSPKIKFYCRESLGFPVSMSPLTD
jgi:hypothetical protein